MFMKTSKATTRSPATVESFQVFSDGSGAPAVVSYNGYAFAFDFLGEIKCNLVRPVSGTRIQARIAKETCERAYRQRLEEVADSAWLALNAEMYS